MQVLRKEPANLPPLVPYKIPVVGHTVQFGITPVELLKEGYQKVRCEILKPIPTRRRPRKT